MSQDIDPGFERYTRTTIPRRIAADPEQLYDLGVYASETALDLSFHYSGTNIGAAMPVWGATEGQLFPDPEPKMITAGSYKPVKELHPNDEYTRVCAEQNLIDNGLEVGDVHMGVLFLRSRFPLIDIEGTGKSEAPHLCQPCRFRALPLLGKDLLVVSFVGSNQMPTQAVTLSAMIKHHDFGEPLELAAEGNGVREFVVENILSAGDKLFKVTSLPRVPSRRYKRSATE
jgi:hypothetical protein